MESDLSTTCSTSVVLMMPPAGLRISVTLSEVKLPRSKLGRRVDTSQLATVVRIGHSVSMGWRLNSCRKREVSEYWLLGRG